METRHESLLCRERERERAWCIYIYTTVYMIYVEIVGFFGCENERERERMREREIRNLEVKEGKEKFETESNF